MRTGFTPISSFESKYIPEALTGCWLWTAATVGGYGQMWNGERSVYAHRFSYETLVGPVPAGLSLDHKCRNRCCANPAHLEPVTHQENVLRGESFAAREAKQTHCLRGHALGEKSSNGPGKRARRCQLCQNEKRRAATLQRTHQ